jgi:acetylornithine/succinyldiaminopimelate/putrescine aminotransferase
VRVTIASSEPLSFCAIWWSTDEQDIAAIIVEPVQGRGGNIVPPYGF